MEKLFKLPAKICSAVFNNIRMNSSGLGELGSGAGRGGGGGGSIRAAGGAFGKMEVANEEEYFYLQQREQVAKMKMDLSEGTSQEKQAQGKEKTLEGNQNKVEELKQSSR